MIIDAILLGAGSGTRFAETATSGRSSLPKQFQPILDVPVFIHALNSLLSLGCFRQILFVVPKTYLALAQEQVRTYIDPSKVDSIRILAGGSRRQDSSRIALEALSQNETPPTRVLIHDACRPFLSDDLLAKVQNCLLDRSYGAWVPVVPVIETIKKVENQQVIETVDRSALQRVQTPQVFEFTVINSLVERVKDLSDLNFTDDAALCEYYGIPVGAFEGDVRNIKLTYDFEADTLSNILMETKKDKKCEPASASTFTA